VRARKGNDDDTMGREWRKQSCASVKKMRIIIVHEWLAIWRWVSSEL